MLEAFKSSASDTRHLESGDIQIEILCSIFEVQYSSIGASSPRPDIERVRIQSSDQYALCTFRWVFLSSCQVLTTWAPNQLASIGYSFQGYSWAFKYSNVPRLFQILECFLLHPSALYKPEGIAERAMSYVGTG